MKQTIIVGVYYKIRLDIPLNGFLPGLDLSQLTIE